MDRLFLLAIRVSLSEVKLLVLTSLFTSSVGFLSFFLSWVYYYSEATLLVLTSYFASSVGGFLFPPLSVAGACLRRPAI